MNYKKTIDWSDEYVLASKKGSGEEVEVASIKFKYDYSPGYGLKLIKWQALDEDEDVVNIITDEDSSSVEAYLDHWMYEEFKADSSTYSSDEYDSHADVAYDMYINEFGGE